MTGNKWLGLPLLLLAAPAWLAQTPAPPAPAGLGPPPSVTLDYGALSGDTQHASADHVRLDYGGELLVTAAHLQGDIARSVYDAVGNVYAHAHDTTLRAERLHADGLDRLGFSEHTTLTRRPFTVRARAIRFDPVGLTADDANVTTADPGDKPDIELRVGRMTVRPDSKPGQPDTGRERVGFTDVSLYLLHNHILTLHHYAATVGGETAGGTAKRQTPHPTVGLSGRYGLYVAYGAGAKVGPFPLRLSVVEPLHSSPQVRVTSSQTLLTGPALRSEVPPPVPPPARPHDSLATLRALTTAPRPPLPAGDPLLFHDFLPDSNPIHLFDQPGRAGLSANEEASYHIEATGRGRDDLFVSRYPEVSLSGSLPVTRVYLLPAPGDPDAFRHYLRHVALYAGLDAGVGRFHEQPDDINATRTRYTFHLSARPLLIAPNTVFQPGFALTTNHYGGIGSHHASGSSAYSYSQYSLALNHYFSPYSAVGAQYVVSQPGGDSPFNFDVLDTSRELDGRIQVGDRKLALAASVRYDALHPHVIDYTLAVAPGLRGFTPVFSYRFFSRTFGIAFEIPGLSF